MPLGACFTVKNLEALEKIRIGEEGSFADIGKVRIAGPGNTATVAVSAHYRFGRGLLVLERGFLTRGHPDRAPKAAESGCGFEIAALYRLYR